MEAQTCRGCESASALSNSDRLGAVLPHMRLYGLSGRNWGTAMTQAESHTACCTGF